MAMIVSNGHSLTKTTTYLDDIARTTTFVIGDGLKLAVPNVRTPYMSP